MSNINGGEVTDINGSPHHMAVDNFPLEHMNIVLAVFVCCKPNNHDKETVFDW